MAMWMNRAGRRGEWESEFIEHGRVYLQWEEIDQDLSQITDKQSIRELLETLYADAPVARISNFLGQIWTFVRLMQTDDLVALPSKTKRVVHFGRVTGSYTFDATADAEFRHYRPVDWFERDIPRTKIPQDILYSFGPKTIGRVDAESRIRGLITGGWKPERNRLVAPEASDATRDDDRIDLEASARDEIAELIGRKFKGHRMAWLVEQVLKAQGYTTYRSPEGPDLGIDILAAPGPLGFGQPRLVVQVKSGDTPTDRPTVDQLIGAMQNFHADQGLFVAWGGFKSSVDREIARHFFRVRLWDQQSLIDELLKHYDALDEDLRAELPLKPIWIVAQTETSSADDA